MMWDLLLPLYIRSYYGVELVSLKDVSFGDLLTLLRLLGESTD